ncbi:MAG: TIGR01777 family protein [Myxococcales bacterium FL481]|nr:MAG: TIGR01777 family protein [Myxococcales bacterium FL481]
MKALVTGATGLVGRGLVPRLPGVHVLSRDPQRAASTLGTETRAFAWNTNSPAPTEAFEDRDIVFHLAGEPIAAKRWTPAQKQRIRASRCEGTRHLVETMLALDRPPATLVSASGIGIYGDRADEALDESSEPGDGFLADICRGWEREAMRAATAGIRVVCMRIGIVLSPRGGALERMLPPFRLGLGGPMGDGRHYMSWIDLDDLIGLLLHVAEHDVAGPVNAVAPNPVTNRDFARTLAHVLSRPAWLAAPRWALRMALGELSDAVLTSQRVAPTVALASGYSFTRPHLETALRHCVERPG